MIPYHHVTYVGILCHSESVCVGRFTMRRPILLQPDEKALEDRYIW
jgi:hypothetical protein